MTRLHVHIKQHNVNVAKYGVGVPLLKKHQTEGGSIGAPANTPVGIVAPPPILIQDSEGGRIRKEYNRNLEKVSYKDPMNIKGGDLLEKIHFERKPKKAHKHDNIKFIF